MSVATTLLPTYTKCETCTRDLLHDDYIRFLLNAGRTMEYIMSYLDFVLVAHDCCKASYAKIRADWPKAARQKLTVALADIMVELDKMDTTIDVSQDLHGDGETDSHRINVANVKADAILYLLYRGVGHGVACRLARTPEVPIPSLTSKDGKVRLTGKYDGEFCPTCDNIVPNQDTIGTLIDKGQKITHYVSQYDIPRRCCIANIKSGVIKHSQVEEIPLHQRGVPTEEMDFVMCTSCGEHIAGLADDSDLIAKNIRDEIDGIHYGPISGDSIRQANRWGLPMQVGYECHSVKNECCRRHILNGDVQIMACDAFDEKTRNQNFAAAMYICN